MESEKDRNITGSELRACSAALERFRIDQARAELTNYQIIVRYHPMEFEIIFIPNQPPSSSSPSGVIEVTVGGGTVYGLEVHYFVDKVTFQISRRHFAR